MAINAYISSPQPITANVQPLTPEQAGVENYYYIKGDTGPQGPPGPQGPDGEAATIAVGTTTTGPAGSSASVSNIGTSHAAVFDFTIPKGDKGDTGSTGAAATIAVGTVSTVGPTDPATVTNSGTSSAAVFNFEIPKGDKGDQGPKGDDGGIFYAVCDTAGATATKAITLSGVTTLTAGLCVNVKFANTNSASNPKLKINSLEAKPIYQYGTTAIGTSAATTSWQAGAVVQLTYDGTGFVRDQGYNTNTTYTVDSVLCATGASTAAKVSTNAGYYVLRAGNIFEITFRYTNTKASALTLNVNSTGAKPIYIDGVASSATNYNIPAGKYICYYDGTNYYINTSGKAPINITGKADGNHDIPSGGSAGKVLKKASATDYDVEWGDADARNIWYATCTTATGTADKVATSTTGDFVLATGNMCVVNFTYYNNQTEPYLSIDGCTKKRIKERSGTGNITTALWQGGESVTVVYDGTDFIVVEGGTASTTYYGVTKLSNSYSSTSQTLAATPQAVKSAYDLAASKVDAAGAAAAAPVQSVNGATGAVTVPTVAIQDTTPTGGELLWVDTDEPGTSISLPEIDDTTRSLVDTWSSSKIANEFASSFAFVQMTTSNTSATVTRPAWASKFLIMKTQGSNYYETTFSFTGGTTTSLGKNTNLVAMARSGVTSNLFLTGVDDYSGNSNTIVVIWG